jgi:hypothetical protein
LTQTPRETLTETELRLILNPSALLYENRCFNTNSSVGSRFHGRNQRLKCSLSAYIRFVAIPPFFPLFSWPMAA